jgi:hypothetical protein
MSRWTPCKRADFIKRLRIIGFVGPYTGTRHEFLVHGEHRLTLPSNAEYSVPQLRLMLREAGAILNREITQDEWLGLR